MSALLVIAFLTLSSNAKISDCHSYCSKKRFPNVGEPACRFSPCKKFSGVQTTEFRLGAAGALYALGGWRLKDFIMLI
jgi:hypothetical protein